MTHDDRQTLRAAALAAMAGIPPRTAVQCVLSRWELQTSNSFRRIGAHGDGDVLCGTKHPIDAHPDLLAAPGVLDYIVAAQPRVVLQLLDDVALLEDKLTAARVITDKIEDVDHRMRSMASGLVALGDAITSFTHAADERELSVEAEKVRALIAQISLQISEVPR